jgi:hypothetical protein
MLSTSHANYDNSVSTRALGRVKRDMIGGESSKLKSSTIRVGDKNYPFFLFDTIQNLIATHASVCLSNSYSH